jgi:hypothetical protein
MFLKKRKGLAPFLDKKKDVQKQVLKLRGSHYMQLSIMCKCPFICYHNLHNAIALNMTMNQHSNDTTS